MKTLKYMLLVSLLMISSNAFASSEYCPLLKKVITKGYEDYRYFQEKAHEAYKAKQWNEVETWETVKNKSLDDASKYSTIYLALCKD